VISEIFLDFSRETALERPKLFILHPYEEENF